MCEQPDMQETAEQKSDHTADDQTGNRIGKSLGGNHSGELVSVHADSPHGTVLFYPGGHTHGNTVDNIKQRNHGNHCQKTITNETRGQIGSLDFLITLSVICKNYIVL